jgi:translation initiation factor IF-3
MSYPRPNFQPQIRVNQRIRAPEVRVINDDGSQAGIMTLGNALKLAHQKGLDLVEVSPDAKPPVCRIIDFGKFRYEQAKKHKGEKTTASKLKELKFHVNVSENDYHIKVRHASEFLQKNMRVKASIYFRGREMQHQEYGMNLVNRIMQDLAPYGHTDSKPRLLGKNLHVILVPGKAKAKVQGVENRPAQGQSQGGEGSQQGQNNQSFGTTIKIDLKPSS